MKIKSWIVPLFFLPLLFLLTNFSSPFTFHNPVRAEILHEESSVEPGRPFWVGIRMTLEPGWHTYWKNPGDAGMAPEIVWELPEGFKAGSLHWPAPEKFTAMEMTGFGYHDEITLLAQITPPSSFADPIKMGALVSWVVCNDSTCLSGQAHLSTTLPTKKSPPEAHLLHAPFFSQARSQIPKKMETIEVKRNDRLISLFLPYTIDQAEFFPETPDQIDNTTELLLVKNDKGTEIILQEKEKSEHLSLKGVLVWDGNPPVDIDLTLDSNLSTDPAWNEKEMNQEEVPQKGLLLALLLAFLGGLCLNGMPCVLPVVSFKVLSFVKIAGESRSKILKHSLIFTLGILLSFWVLAGVLLLLKTWGHSVGWGFQLQEPLFVAALAAVIFIFGLSLFGVFELGIKIAALAGQAASQPNKGLSSSFFSGVLATAVATPCSGPFLGTAIGLAVTLSTLQAMTVFSSLALGMASPYLLLGAFPKMLQFMPKPGNWMVAFKELMGWMMLATVLWLIWVFGAQTSSMALSLLLGSFFLMAIGCWVFGKWGTPLNKKYIRRMGMALAFLFLASGGYVLVQASILPGVSWEQKEISQVETIEDSPEEEMLGKWIPFSQEKLEKLQAKGVTVFVDFTAKWCLTCQANHFVLDQEEVRTQFKKQGIVKMVADWTKKDPMITETLARLGRNSVPVYALYSPEKEKKPILLPQLLSSKSVIEHLEKM